MEVSVPIMPYEQGGALDRGVVSPGAGDLHLPQRSVHGTSDGGGAGRVACDVDDAEALLHLGGVAQRA